MQLLAGYWQVEFSPDNSSPTAASSVPPAAAPGIQSEDRWKRLVVTEIQPRGSRGPLDHSFHSISTKQQRTLDRRRAGGGGAFAFSFSSSRVFPAPSCPFGSRPSGCCCWCSAAPAQGTHSQAEQSSRREPEASARKHLAEQFNFESVAVFVCCFCCCFGAASLDHSGLHVGRTLCQRIHRGRPGAFSPFFQSSVRCACECSFLPLPCGHFAAPFPSYRWLYVHPKRNEFIVTPHRTGKLWS